MSNIEDWSKAEPIVARFSSSLCGLALSYLATLEKIVDITLKPIDSNPLDKKEICDLFILTGVSAFQIKYFLVESSIMALAKVIEDTSIELKRNAGFRFHLENNNHNVIYLNELKMIKALANVIKHNLSELDRNTSKSAKFLVDECGLPNKTELKILIIDNHPCFNILGHLPKVFLALLWLVGKGCEVEHPLMTISRNQALNFAYQYLMPELFKMDIPQTSRTNA